MKTSSLIVRLRQHADPNVLGEDVSILLEMAAAEIEELSATEEKLLAENRKLRAIAWYENG